LIVNQDILQYLNNLRKSSDDDPSHKWIGSYNGRQAVFLKFFKWLYDSNQHDYRKRNIPDCMQGIKKLNRKEKHHTDNPIFGMLKNILYF